MTTAVSGRRVRLDLAYDGTGLCGWQIQPDAPTVQGWLERALAQLCGHAVRVRGAGRTDAGVHACHQVADAWIETRLDDPTLERGLAALLPRAIRPLAVCTVHPAFDARRQARRKVYQYLLDRSPHGDPFLRRFALHVPGELDEDALREAMRRLPGRHDWRGFAPADPETGTAVRDLERVSIVGGEALAALTFCGRSFLRHMVRALVGTLLEVARGRFPPQQIDRILETGDRNLAGPTAPAQGLCLVAVFYEDADPGSLDELAQPWLARRPWPWRRREEAAGERAAGLWNAGAGAGASHEGRE